jgi:hypothetical protein
MPRRLFDDLLRSIEQAASRSEHAAAAGRAAADAQKRSELLRAFVKHFREHRDELPLRCAWCGRIRIGDRWVTPEDFLHGNVPERLRERATHGICDDCLKRENAAARARRAHGILGG